MKEIIKIRKTASNSSVSLLRDPGIPDRLKGDTNAVFPYNFAYLGAAATAGDVLLKSFQVLMELVLTPTVAATLLRTVWHDANYPVTPFFPRLQDITHPIVAKILEHKNKLHELSVYVPIYNYSVINKKMKSLRYTVNTPTTRGSSNIHFLPKIRTRTKTFETPCILCSYFPRFQAGGCDPLNAQSDRVAGTCVVEMRLNIPEVLL